MNIRDTGVGRRGGFTMAELMVAVLISAGVLLAVVVAFSSQVRQYRQYRDQAEMNQNLRSAAELISRDARTAGYGMDTYRSQYSTWITWVSGITNSIVVQNSASGVPDRLYFVGAFSPPLATTAAAINPGSFAVPLQTGQGALFDTTRRKLIYLGRGELLRVVSISGDTLRVSASPTRTDRGINYRYPAGSQVELVEVIEYRVESSFTNKLGRPFLVRNNNQSAVTGSAVPQMAVIGIEDLQATVRGTSLTVDLTAVSQRREYGYRHPVKNDQFRRDTTRIAAQSRNMIK